MSGEAEHLLRLAEHALDWMVANFESKITAEQQAFCDAAYLLINAVDV